MDILDDMGVSKLSAKVFSKVNYSFKKASDYRDENMFVVMSTDEVIKITLL